MLKIYLEQLDNLRTQLFRAFDNDSSKEYRDDIRQNIKTTKKDIVKELEKLGYKNNVKSLLNTDFNMSFTGEYKDVYINYRNFKPKFYYENDKHILIFGSSIKNYYCTKSNGRNVMELAYIIDKETNTSIYEN